MALEGTIRDFALPDIFQLIGIQRKTGVLTLMQAQEAVTIKFLEGRVVEADTVSHSLEDRLGTVLVRTGRISQAQLDEALRIQRQTLQRLGHILVRREFISPDELIDALKIQSSQIIYRLFRWREGSYHFDSVDKLEYDESHSTPISSETILMEGARMVDEWPIIERRIPSERIVVRKTPAAEQLDLEPDEAAELDDLELDLGIALDLQPADSAPSAAEAEPAAESAIKLSPDERMVLALVDGRRTVREIVDRLTLPEFETFRALSEMITRSLIEHVDESPATTPAAGRRLLPRLGLLVAKTGILALSLLAVLTLDTNPFTPWRVLEASAATGPLRTYATLARLERIEGALGVFYLDTGSYPLDLETLVRYEYLDSSALVDSWGSPFHFRLSGGGYQLRALDAEGAARPGLGVARNFSEAQRLMGDGPQLSGE